MKRYITPVVIAVMSVLLVYLLVTRERMKHDAPAEVLVAASSDAGASIDAALPADAAPGDAGAKPPAVPLRVVALGWELCAAGVAMTPPDGGAPTTAFELAPEPTLDAIETRLARGGADPQGADVAVLPLPAFVASFERLRALEPRAFLVLGFSRGREEVRAAPGALSKPPPGVEEVRMVALAPATAGDAAARSAGSESATVLGLLALDLLAVPPARLRYVGPDTPEAKTAPFAAIVKGASDERKLAFSTVDASRMIPIVAVAPKAVLEAREPAIRDWSKAWLDGLSRAKADIPGIARRLATKDGLPLAAGVGGAPDAIALVERLGQVESVTIDQQRLYLGPVDANAARTTVRLDALAQRTWQLARGGGIVASAAPEPLPIDARVVSAIAPALKASAVASTTADAGAPFAPVAVGAVPLVAYRAVEGDVDSVTAQVVFLAGVFERAIFRVSAKGGEKAARAIATSIREKGVAQARLATAAAEPQNAFAVVEVLAPP